jgi:sterol desaturase/sphingolipid hydroxylase (fatty acid hydroxylase superfamily)
MGDTMFFFFFGIALGSLIEWGSHKYLLHSFRSKLFSYSHFSIHHRNCRQNDNYDSDYENFPPTTRDSGLTEIVLLVSAVAVTSPLALISPWMWVGLIFHAHAYYYVHRKSHLDVDWGKKWLPWHYDHHMGENQNANWGVTLPLWDYILGTRVKMDLERITHSDG